MAYVEVHPERGGFQIFVDGEPIKPWVGNPEFVDSTIRSHGIRNLGPWEPALRADGVEYQRARMLGI